MNSCACSSVVTRASAQTNRDRRICSSCTPGRLIVRMSRPPYAGGRWRRGTGCGASCWTPGRCGGRPRRRSHRRTDPAARAARRTFVPRLLAPDQVPAGVALNQLSFQAGMMLGPVLAGLVTAAGGLRMCYLADVVSFAGTLYALARLPPVPPLGGAARPGVSAVVEGLRFIRRTPVLAGIFLADLDAMVLGMPFALFPALTAAHFGGAPQTLGLLSAAPAIGGLAGSALSGPVGHIDRPGRALLAAVAVWGAAIAAFGRVRTLWLGLGLLVIAGAADTISVIFRATIVQVATPDRYRGRVSGVAFVFGARARIGPAAPSSLVIGADDGAGGEERP